MRWTTRNGRFSYTADMATDMVYYSGAWKSLCGTNWPFQVVGSSMLGVPCKSTRPYAQKMRLSNMRNADIPHHGFPPFDQASLPLCQCGPHSGGNDTHRCFSRCKSCLTGIVARTKRLRRFAIIVMYFGALSSNKGRNTGPVYTSTHPTYPTVYYYDVTQGLMDVTGKKLLFEAGGGRMGELESAKKLLKGVEELWVSGSMVALPSFPPRWQHLTDILQAGNASGQPSRRDKDG